MGSITGLHVNHQETASEEEKATAASLFKIIISQETLDYLRNSGKNVENANSSLGSPLSLVSGFLCRYLR